jgi:Family of unknown function (DUF5994)
MTPLGLIDSSAAPLRDDAGRDEVRLVLLDAEANHGTALDGAWWPRSTSLSADLPFVVAALHREGFRITRAAYNPALWDPAPPKMHAENRTVRLGWFNSIDPHLLSLTGGNGEHVELLVVPPDTAPLTAARAMALAAARRNRLSATAVLAAAELSDVRNPTSPLPAPRSADEGVDLTRATAPTDIDAWESEGGFSPR